MADDATRGVQTLHPAATERLHEYWVHGEGAAKIAWGSPGDFDRCVAHLSQYIHDPQGYCNLAHKAATGMYPATHAKMLGKHRSEARIHMPTRDDLIRAVTEATYADPGYQPDGQPRYPIDSEAHVRATWDSLNQADNAAAYSPGQLATIKDRIKAAGKEYNITFEDSSRAFAAGEHPHVPAGSATGGQFAAKGGGGNKSPHKSPHSGHPAMHPASHPAGGSLGFDAKANHGTGYGSVNGDSRVHTLQQTLNRLGITDGSGKALKDDGKLGPKTTSAVKKLQTRLGMKADGQVSPEFLKAVAGMKTLPAHHTAKRGEDLIDVNQPTPFVRSFALQDISIRAGGDGRTVDAYATVFDTPTPIHDQDGDYIEVIDRRAFDRILPKLAPSGGRSSWRVGVFYNHGMTLHGTPSDVDSMPIGIPLDIKADGHGLFTRTRYHAGERADMVLEAIREGSIGGYSFSGRFDRSDPPSSRGGYRPDRAGNLRTVRRTESTLREYGPTPFPAYPEAAILGVRAEKITEQLDRITELLRSGGTLPDFDPADLPLLTGAPAWDSPPEDSHTVRSGRSVKEEIAAARSAFLQKYGSEQHA
jgi:HK97 family phage prohead protease